MAIGVFWCLTVVLVICALSCFLPALINKTNTVVLPNPTRMLYGVAAASLIIWLTYSLYLKLGAAQQLSGYYAVSNMQQRDDFKKVRPLYARLQRELVKNKLNLEPELNNIELILHFAQAHSQAQQGVLDINVKNLLHAILKVMPQQVTVLNLLAVDAYKTENYARAIECWQLILQQFTSEMRGSELEIALKNKIKDTEIRIKHI